MRAAAPAAVLPPRASAGPKPTVLQVLHSLNVGGAEVLAARLARNLSDRFRFVFACLDELGTLGEELRQEGFTVEVMGRKPGFDLGCVRKLARMARAEQADMIHAHQYTPFFYSRAPGSLLRRPPVLFNEHGRFHPDLPNRKRMIFNRLFLRRVDRVVAVGGAVKQALIENEGIPASRIEVIHNGVRLADFSADESLRRQVRAELGIDERDFVAIQVARLDYLKDYCTAVRTAERVARQGPSFKLLLVGEGPERQKIEAEIARRGMQQYVRLLGQRSDVARRVAAAGRCLVTSISEGIPVTFIEAMGAALPIVSTEVGGVREVVEPNGTGLLAGAGDDAALSAAVLRLAGDQRLRQQLGERGRARAEELFSEDEMHERYSALYCQMIRRPTTVNVANPAP
jgi:glycosyltransferase involved in cell wall biosynthesis